MVDKDINSWGQARSLLCRSTSGQITIFVQKLTLWFDYLDKEFRNRQV